MGGVYIGFIFCQVRIDDILQLLRRIWGWPGWLESEGASKHSYLGRNHAWTNSASVLQESCPEVFSQQMRNHFLGWFVLGNIQGKRQGWWSRRQLAPWNPGTLQPCNCPCSTRPLPVNLTLSAQQSGTLREAPLGYCVCGGGGGCTVGQDVDKLICQSEQTF